MWESRSATTKRKGSAKVPESQDVYPRLSVMLYRFLTRRTNLKTSGAEEVVHESQQPVASIPFPDDLTDEASWQRGLNCCGYRDYN